MDNKVSGTPQKKKITLQSPFGFLKHRKLKLQIALMMQQHGKTKN